MDRLKIYTHNDITPLINERDGEIKLGQKVQLIRWFEDLQNCNAKFVLLGIPEDIGVRANLGIGGTQTAWLPALKILLNMQSNSFFSGEELLVLGHLEIEEPADKSLSSLRNKVRIIDNLVYPIIEQIIAANKIPIVIGGGHNNAFGMIWGASLAHQQKMNIVNIDAHADLRKKEGRHSGNGFTYALQDGHLEQYRIFGLQQSYAHADLSNYIKTNSNIQAFYYEDLLKSEETMLKNWKGFINDLPEPCGLEVDLDSIANLLSSAGSPSGFSLKDMRAFLLSCDKKFSYLHLCEGATQLADGRNDLTTAKTIASLVSDFIKALLPQTFQQPSS
ncbi:formimidoylglutamase [Pedobacter sp. Du54]|uniref:formimidoylglutamase n=1 Tax=Pedobacter anseongensis TaxID=3133439 RepID=UPI00309C4BE0